MDLSTVKAELLVRDTKIKELQTERSKLKSLIKRAKATMDSINSKYKSSQEEVKSLNT